jgi:phage shock protein A
MSESIFIRVQRVLSAGADSAVGAAERVSGASLMRQAIRDIDGAIEDIGAARDAAESRRVHAEHQHKRLRGTLATLEEQARYALSKQREDLAEAAVGRQIALEAQVAELGKARTEATAELAQLADGLIALKARKAQMEAEFATFQAARRDADADSPDRSRARRTARRADRAEEAFARGMAAAGGVNGEPATVADLAKLAEVDAMRRADAIAERLAAMRARPTPAKPRKKAG